MSTQQEHEPALRRLEDLTRALRLDGAALIETEDNRLLADGVVLVSVAEANTLVLRCPVDQKALLLQTSPGTYFETDAWIGKPAVLVHLDRIDDEELSLRLQDAWRYRTTED